MMINELREAQLNNIVVRLRAGALVAIPTETVYGLAGDARNEQAIQKIFSLKKRPLDNPLIVHIAAMEQMEGWACDIPEVAWQLAKAFWPGPLTLIVPKASHVSPLLTAGQLSVALRVPAHPMTLKILQAFGGGLAAPSANVFQGISPTHPAHVAQCFPDDLWIVDGGASSVGVESTIIDCAHGVPVILRSGMITSALIAQKTGLIILSAHRTSVKHAGQHLRHYAPKTPLCLRSSDELMFEVAQKRQTQGVGLLTYQSIIDHCVFKKVITLPCQVDEYAKHFYAALHELDQLACAEIWVELPPKDDAWQVIHDRLRKAATRI